MIQQRPGALFANRFEIESKAGVGGMSTIYRARDRFTGDAIALKLLQSHGEDPQEAARFAREAQLLSTLNHPGIVSYITHGLTPDGQRYIAMEWLSGEDLASRLSRGPLPIADAVRLIGKVAEALSCAHHSGVVHRDIKPSNIYLVNGLVNGDVGSVKLLDFGIARRHSKSIAMTRTGVLIGTPEYMAPEQVRGARDLTAATDIFSLGCVFYECLAGETPFAGEHIASILVRILYEEPSPIAQRCANLPREIVDIIGQMLAKEPAQRYRDATALGSALAALGELGTLAAPSLLGVGTVMTPFAEREQELCSIVVAAEPAVEGDDNTVALSEDSAETAERRRSLLAALSELGVQAEFMVGGSLVVAVRSGASVTDQVAVAARTALVIKSRWPRAEVAVATGRGTANGPVALGEVADRAGRLLSARSTPAPQEPVAQVSVQVSGVWVDPLSRRLLGPRFSVVMKGDAAMLISEEKDADASRPLLGKPTPCVGRDHELVMLESHLVSCIEESESRMLLVTAPPGIGKSRLRHEFLRRVEKRDDDVTVLLGRGDLIGAGTAYGILADAIRKLCGLSGSEPQSEQRRRLGERISQRLRGGERERAIAFLCELCGTPLMDETPLLRAARQDPKIMTDQITQAAVAWLGAECQSAPVLLVLDDLQWGDAMTIALVAETVVKLASAPLFVLALARPEIHDYFPKVSQIRGMHEMSLRGLSKKACERLIHQVLGKQVAPTAMARIIEHSAGNALFLEELIRSLDEGSSGDATQDTPETVLAMLQARIGRFATGPRRAIRAAAVFGQTFWLAGVAGVLGLSKTGSTLTNWIDSLVDAEVIVARSTSRFANEIEYGFRHALVRDAAYSLLTAQDLLTGHLRAGEFLEAAGERDAALVAGHFLLGKALQRAAPLYAQAGTEAARLHLHSVARQHYSAAVGALSELPPDGDIRRLHAEVLAKQTQVSLISDTADQNLKRLDTAEALIAANLAGSPEQADPRDELLMGRVQYAMGRVYYYGGRHAEAIRCYQRAVPIGQRFKDPELSAMPAATIGMALMTQGHMGKARQYLADALEPLRQTGNDYEEHRAQAYLGTVLVATGRYPDGLRELHQAEAWARDNNHSLLVCITQILRALAHRSAMDWTAMLDCIAGVGDAALLQGEKLYAIFGWSLEAWALIHLGQSAKAAELRGKAKVLDKELGGKHAISHWFLAADGEAALLSGNPELTQSIAKSLVEVSAAATWPKSWGIAERLWGAALGQLGAPMEEIDVHMQESLRVLALGDLTLDAAQTELCWGQILRARGLHTQAAPHLDKARSAFAAAGCDHVLPGLHHTDRRAW